MAPANSGGSTAHNHHPSFNITDTGMVAQSRQQAIAIANASKS